MSQLRDNHDLVFELLCMCVEKLGGRVELLGSNQGPFNLANRFTDSGIELMLLPNEVEADDLNRKPS